MVLFFALIILTLLWYLVTEMLPTNWRSTRAIVLYICAGYATCFIVADQLVKREHNVWQISLSMSITTTMCFYPLLRGKVL